ncbi:hypothetical protein BKA58DRAFT_311630 [Alternaria rosae]|uniref:uncharacterized protein n=1 Tax=Alternaria rosae TaxID=1187941 RepID=UPI001E8EC63D|nr:uncharacterized protein BKA58DRAFT_311630 [Alternaria rosae]KAH6875890.1 hypothetical protein BKA58DRAFT_311630 [Alternaria rosae]
MASHGKVMDLFDERYLELQDVVGNVEPLPTLVPYEQYKSHAITYRMDTNHDVFFALLQDFTERKALETGKELWTWCVQWEVNQTAARQSLAAPQSAKRPRLDLGQPNTPTAPKPASNAPPMTLHARCIDPDLLHEEDMLRILVDIVQIDSTVVPNFIEFLYRWIDFYEGDGKALKAALHGEIPSLWDFEYHPFLVPQAVKKEMNQARGATQDGGKDGQGGDTTTQMRQKPDLAALERKTEESERLKYREVHFGIQPPKLDEPLPPLINIPRDQYKRAKYYEACFKSRQRAFFLLVEAGVTPQNMRDYHRDQTMSLQETPPLVEAGGLKNYEKDAKLAQVFTSLKEQHRAKQLEISISSKLADEAQFAARSAAPRGPSGVPLIPTTAIHAHRPDVTDGILRKIQQTKDEGQQRINIVPTPLVGKMKSRLFRGARDRAGLQEMFARSSFPSIPHSSRNFDGGRRNNNDGNGSTDEDSDDDMNAPRARMRLLPRPSFPSPATPPRPSLPPLPRPPPAMTSTQPRDTFIPDTTLAFQGGFGPYARPPLPPGFEHQHHSPSGYRALPSVAPPGLPPLWFQPTTHPPNLSQQSYTSSWPTPLGRADHAPPPAFAQRLAAAQETQGHATSYGQRLPNAGPPLPRAPDLPSLSRGVDQGRSTQQRQQLSLNSLLAPPQATMQRTAPSPLNLRPPGSPLSSFAPSLLATSPFTTSHRGIPVQIYLPKILVPANTIGPGGLRLGDNGLAETDAFLLGYTHPKSGKITLNRAVFLPLGVWANAQDRVRKGHYTVLESYAAPNRGPSISHHAAYEKAKQAYEMMVMNSPVARERELTKRWRASRGRMTTTQRGAIWEGWAVEVDREIALSKEDRKGAFVQNALVDGVDGDSDEARRRREIEELLETDEAWDYEDEDEDDEVQEDYGDEMEGHDDSVDGDDDDDDEEGEEDREGEDVYMDG